MNEWEDELTIRRILVALDASQPSLAALEAAVELATRLRAELLGLFVEDVNLLRLAGLPFAREIHLPSATIRPINGPTLERELHAWAARVRQILAAAASQARVDWSFRVVRGHVAPEVLAAAQEADLLSLGVASGPLTRHRHLGSTARLVAAESPRTVLLLQQGEKLGRSIVAVYDGSVIARRALVLAARIASGVKENAAAVTVLVLGDSPPVTTNRLEEEATAHFQQRGLRFNCRLQTGTGIAALVQALRGEQGGLLVLGGNNSLARPEAIQDLLDAVEWPVLLVR
jgi:nucleotide-binding universal stress UspA family protein